MTAFYRNRTTGIVQSHPKSGLGESLNSDEIEESARPVKPRTSLAPSKAELKARKALVKPTSTSTAKSGSGETQKKDGDQ